MALKDWKKRSGIYERDNTKKNNNLFISFDSNFGKPYKITFGVVGSPQRKRFKTKSQAMRFAKNYMRKN